MPLTDTQIKKLKPSADCTPSRPDKYSDGAGLQLLVRPTGTKTWLLAYRWRGKQKNLTLGKYPAVSLKEARAKALEIKQQISVGIEPISTLSTNNKIQDKSRLLSTIAEQWYSERKPHLAKTTYQRSYALYIRDIYPAIGHKQIDEVTPPEVLAIGRSVEARGALNMARRAIGEVGQLYKHAIRQGFVIYNPARDLAEAIPPQKTKHHARIEAKDLPELLAKIESYSGNIMVRSGLKLLCLTFLRTTELRELRWSEIDTANRLIRIPAERMKADRPHLVPLATQALAILDELRAISASDEFVFFNTTTKKPLSQNAFIGALYRMGYKGVMTGHGFRGLASTVLHEQGFMHDAIEMQLAHDKDNKVSKAYNGAQHLEYRVGMMQDWADFIDSY